MITRLFDLLGDKDIYENGGALGNAPYSYRALIASIVASSEAMSETLK